MKLDSLMARHEKLVARAAELQRRMDEAANVRPLLAEGQVWLHKKSGAMYLSSRINSEEMRLIHVGGETSGAPWCATSAFGSNPGSFEYKGRFDEVFHI